MSPRSISLDFAAAGAATLIGALSFGVFHSLWIRHVPRVFAEGVLNAAVAALALAWAIRLTGKRYDFGARLRDGLLLGTVLWLALVPYELVGAKWGPWSLPTSLIGFLKLSWLGFLGAPVGAALGYALTRSVKGSLVWALAAVAVNIHVGGGLASFGGRGSMFALFLWLLPTYLLAGTALVGTYALANRLTRQAPLTCS